MLGGLDYLINDTFYNILIWWPWISLWNDIFFLQIIILYFFFLLIFSSNLYYVLLYLFLEIFYIGLFLGFFQMDLFTGFLWVTECTVIFISTILLFYLNTKGNFLKLNLVFFKYNGLFIFFIIFFCFITYYGELEGSLYLNLNYFDFWDNFYEALYNINNNYFTGLLLSYYIFNSAEFILLGLLLLVGSVLCVNLFKLNNSVKLQNYDNLFNFFDFYNDFISYLFLRKQNLFKQQKAAAATKIFKKKN